MSARGGAGLRPATIHHLPVSPCLSSLPSSEMPPEQVEALARRYALPDWFARAIIAELGPTLAEVRCTQAARRWSMLIEHVSGRKFPGMNDLGKLCCIYDAECARLRRAERVDALRLLGAGDDLG